MLELAGISLAAGLNIDGHVLLLSEGWGTAPRLCDDGDNLGARPLAGRASSISLVAIAQAHPTAPAGQCSPLEFRDMSKSARS